jgi:hypothetical protein
MAERFEQANIYGETEVVRPGDALKALSFFVTTETTERGAFSDMALPFRKVLYSRLLHVPITDVLDWESNLLQVTSYLGVRKTRDPEYWHTGRALMDGLREPLKKALTRRGRWSRIVALFTYQELQTKFRETRSVRDATGELAEAQRAWEAEWDKFMSLDGAIDRGKVVPEELAVALSDFYVNDAKNSLPAALAMYLFMRVVGNDPLYNQYLNGRPELAVYLGFMSGTVNLEPRDDLALSFLVSLKREGAPTWQPLEPQPSPLGSTGLSPLALGCLVAGIGFAVASVMAAVVAYMLWLNA